MQKCPAASRRSHRTPTRGKKETAFRWGQTGMLSCVDTGHKPQLDSFLSLYFLRSSFSHHSPCSLQRYQRILSECVLGRSGTRRGYSLKIFCASSLWKGKKGTEKLNWKSSSSSFFRPLDTDCGDEEKKKSQIFIPEAPSTGRDSFHRNLRTSILLCGSKGSGKYKIKFLRSVKSTLFLSRVWHLAD